MNWPNFFAELKRRHVYRAAAVYTMTSWLLIQVATQVSPFSKSNWVVRLIILVLVAGFPIAISLAWAFKLTPAGIVKATEAPVERAGDWNIVHRIYTTVIALLALAIVVLLFLRYSGSQSAPGGASVEKSIAVLPFENLSEDKDNVYFADGMQDDLLTNLAKIQDLTVISRTSVMKFRDPATRNLREIGKALGVANILEGSVRRKADRVVVNAQLIDARSDRQLWANHYDRTIQDSLGLKAISRPKRGCSPRPPDPEEKERVGKADPKCQPMCFICRRCRSNRTGYLARRLPAGG